MNSRSAVWAQNVRQHIVGLNTVVPLFSGHSAPYINFDNAASTPALTQIVKTIEDFLPWYSSIHRGAGFKSQVSTAVYEEARTIVLDFFGGNDNEHVVIFGKNSTEAINKLSYRLALQPDDVVLVSLAEHHSNDLPWRAQAQVKHIQTDGLGQIIEADLVRLLDQYRGAVKLVAISGGSNVTGYVPDIRRIATLAHQAGAQILVDCAQIAAHRSINLGNLSDPTHLDYIAISGHKMYAPFGTGALIGRRDTFSNGEPELKGGGTIDIVTTENVAWASPPDRDEAGSPNVVGAVALARALGTLQEFGMDKIARHETELTSYALAQLAQIPEIKIYGDANPLTAKNRLGVIPFAVGDVPHGLVAAILSAEYGIGVRSGCFCAHPYVIHLMNVEKTRVKQFGDEILRGDRRRTPGLVRVSFGMYNTFDEIDKLGSALKNIANGNYQGKYQQDKATGDWKAADWQPEKPTFLKRNT